MWPPVAEAAARPIVYSDQRLDRYWKDAREILGSRLGYIAETEHDSISVTVEVGAVDMAEEDKRQLQAKAPAWVNLVMFRTKYSFGELRQIAFRGEAALRDAGMGRLWVGFAEFGEPDRITIMLRRDRSEARKVLRGELPAGSYRIEIGVFRTFDEGSHASSEWPLPVTITAGSFFILAILLGIQFLVQRRRTRPALP